MSTVAVVVPAILLTRTRATRYVDVSLWRPTVAIIVAIGIMQATSWIFAGC